MACLACYPLDELVQAGRWTTPLAAHATDGSGGSEAETTDGTSGLPPKSQVAKTVEDC